MDTYSLPLQTVKLICNSDNISTGVGRGQHTHTRDDRYYTCQVVNGINDFILDFPRTVL